MLEKLLINGNGEDIQVIENRGMEIQNFQKSVTKNNVPLKD